MLLQTYANPILSMMPIMPKSNPMKLQVIARCSDCRKYHIRKSYDLGDSIPIPPNRVILVTIPDGVFRCNLNKGIFAEDRKFIQNEDSNLPHIIRFINLESTLNPTLTIKLHYAETNKDVIVEFA